MNFEKIKNNRIVRHTYYFARSVVCRKTLVRAAEKTLEAFGRTFQSEADKKACVNDMMQTYARYGFYFDEYLYYNFEKKNRTERLAFVADWEHLGYACTMNSPENNSVFDNKNETYERFSKFYQRTLILFENQEQYPDFEKFISGHPRFIIKPMDSSCGKGIQILESEAHMHSDKWLAELLAQYNGRFIVEELIVQKEEMAKLHPSSVNTVRVPTIRLDDEVRIVRPFLRVGQHGKCVDNGGAGGILCPIDIETGRIFAAADEYGKRYTTHPQTNADLIGFQIPDWDEAKALARQLAMVVPNNRYTGWDLALTDNGWVLVEANRRGQFVFQLASQKGFREEINEIFKLLGKKY